MHTILTAMATGIIAAGVFLALLYALQDSLILLPGIGGGGPDVLMQCAPGSRPWRDDGQYRGKICEPPGTAKATILIYHGNAGTVDDRSSLAQVLTARGYRVVLVEYPGFGARAGSATVNGALAAALEDFSAACAAWPPPLYLLGESFGAGIAAEVAREHGEKLAGLILLTPWDSLAKVVDAKFFRLPIRLLLHQRFDIAEAISSYRGQVVIVAAERDEVLPVSHARALATAAPAAAYLEIPEAEHNSLASFMTQKDWDWVLASLVRPREHN